MIETLRREATFGEPNYVVAGADSAEAYRSDVQNIVSYILSVATFERADRLFPADGSVFRTNPFCVAYGAAGVACALKAIGVQIPDQVADWILNKPVTNHQMAPGLYVGRSGVAWSLLELGLRSEAEAMFRSVLDHPLRFNAFDVFYGAAGWGLTSLRFFCATQDELYLSQALEAGAHLESIARQEGDTVYWEEGRDIPLGYAHGASGVALFLLYLYLASGQERFYRLGTKAIAFDLANATPYRDGTGLSWTRYANLRGVVYPYWIYGSAGVGCTLIRYQRLDPTEGYRIALQQIAMDINRKYTVFPGAFKGLAGLGECLLDLFHVTKDRRYLDSAYRVASGISLFKIPKESGVAFPGDSLRRISCDYGTGGAGIAHFLHRLDNPSPSGLFTLDQLFA